MYDRIRWRGVALCGVAGWHSASRWNVRVPWRTETRYADCQSAIRQTASLRYEGGPEPWPILRSFQEHAGVFLRDTRVALRVVVRGPSRRRASANPECPTWKTGTPGLCRI